MFYTNVFFEKKQERVVHLLEKIGKEKTGIKKNATYAITCQLTALNCENILRNVIKKSLYLSVSFVNMEVIGGVISKPTKKQSI